MDSRGIENRVCYEFVVVHGRVRNYQASELRSACQPPPPIYPSSPLLSPLPGQVYFQIASGEKRGGGGKQKRRNREYLHSPTPFPLPIISLLWTRDEKLERLKKKEASKQASKHAARAPTLWPTPSKVDWRYTRKNSTDERKLIFRVSWPGWAPRLNFVSLSIRSLRMGSWTVPSCCYVGYEMIRGTVLAFSRHEIKLCPATCIEIHSIIRRQRICNEITSGSDMRNLTSLSTFRAVNLNSKLSDERANQLWNREDDRDRIDRVLLSGDK